jgi:hypothetical protein
MRPRIVIDAKIVGSAMPDRLSHASQNPNGAVGRRHSYKPRNPTHDNQCGTARLALSLDRLRSEEWVSG